MRRSKFPALTLALLLAGGTPTFSCELCAVYAAHGLGDPAHGWFFGAAEQFTSFGGLRLSGNEIPNPADQRLATSITQFVLGYSFNERFSLQTNIPYIHRSFTRPVGPLIEEGTVSGFGDAILLGQMLLWQKSTEDTAFTASLLGGLKFPTGSTAYLKQETQRLDLAAATTGITHHLVTPPGTTASAIHGNDLTLGSGSFDARLGASFYYRHKRAFFTGAFQYAICTEGAYGYRFANDLTWDGGPGYYLISEPSYTLSLEASMSGEHKGSDTYADQQVDNTGFTSIFLGPKLNFTWKDWLAAHVGVDLPVSNTNRGLQAVPGTRVRAGFTWLLGPGSGSGSTASSSPKSIAMDGSAPPIWTPAPESRFYGGVEYLLWWVKDAPLSIPLVSTGPVRTTHHGLLGAPAVGSDSTVLYGAPFPPAKGGDDAQRFPGFSGGRVTLGYSLGNDHRFGIEASGFALQKQSAGYSATGGPTGEPILGIPVYNDVAYSIGTMTIQRGEDSLPFSLPEDPNRFRSSGALTGGIEIKNDLQLWGAEVNGVISLYRKPSWELSGLVGFRYLDLTENLTLTSNIEGVSGPFTGQSGVVHDGFGTRNQFYGANLGLRGSYSSGRLSVDLAARVALGCSHEVLDVTGGFSAVNFGPPYTSGPEGVFAQPANEGRRSAGKFAVVPDVQLKIGYALTPRLRATIGYDFLFYSSVLRPGEQMSRSIPKGQTFRQASPTISTTSPAPLFKSTGFFAHGVNVGMEFRF